MWRAPTANWWLPTSDYKMNSEHPTLLFRNARMVNEGAIVEGDLLVSAGRIARIAPMLDARAALEIDAHGRWLLPGMIDDQVHFRTPGLTHKGCIATESRAAVAGGITSFMDMPNTLPPTLNLIDVAEKQHIAARTSLANYAFHLGASRHNLAQLAQLDTRQIAGVKVFMGASTGDLLMDDPVLLERLFADCPTLLLAHCEDSSRIREREQAWLEACEGDIPISAHPHIRDHEACYRSSALAVSLARRHGTRLHVLHVSTDRELALFDDKPLQQKHISAEVCVHHLLFDDGDYPRLQGLIKCNPAIKTRGDRDALRQALLGNRLDVIGTDHAPHTLEEKNRPYLTCPSGLPLAQHAMPALLSLVNEGVISLPALVEKTCHRVADLFGIEERGYLRESYWADLVLIGDNPLDAVEPEILSGCVWSPFAGRHFTQRVDTTVVSGQIAWHNGALNNACRGLPLRFMR